MHIQVVSIYDRALDAFSRPVFVNSVGQAIRSFGDEVNNVQSEMSKHPDDYDLYHLGSFDDSSGKFVCLDEPKQLALGKQLVVSKH